MNKHSPTPMTLSEHLKKWRADRPDEWVMDKFIRKAEELEEAANSHYLLFKQLLKQED